MKKLTDEKRAKLLRVAEAVKAANGNVSQAAISLDITRGSARRAVAQIRKHGLDSDLAEDAPMFTSRRSDPRLSDKQADQADLFGIPNGQLHSGWVKDEGASYYFQVPKASSDPKALWEAISESLGPLPRADINEDIAGPFSDDISVIMPIADLHIGLLTDVEEVGVEWNTEIATKAFRETWETLVDVTAPAETCLIAQLGDLTHTGGADAGDQDVTATTVAGISLGDTVDLRYKYTYTGSDGSSGTIFFIATNGLANYGPLFVSDAPLDPGVTYTFGTFNTDGATPYSSLVPCFTAGTHILTQRGQRPIDDLRVGDLIVTRDNGLQPLRWIGRCTVPANGKAAPVHIAKGVLGNTQALVVSPNHRMLIESISADLWFGEREVLIAAKHLIQNDGITQLSGGMVTYIHLLFDEHQIVSTYDCPSESFFPGDEAMDTLSHETQREVLDLFPELSQSQPKAFQQTARLCLKALEARVLFA